MDTLEIRRGERCQEFELLDLDFTVGSGDDDRLRVVGSGVRAHELRFVKGELGFRVEPGRDGGVVRVNGVEVRRRELRHGDLIAVGTTVIAFREAGKPWPVEPEPVQGGLDLKIGTIPVVSASRRASASPSRAGPSSPAQGRSAPVVRRDSKSPRARDQKEPAKTSRARRRSNGKPWLLWNLLLVAGIVAWIVIRSLLSRGMERDARDLVLLAESQHRSFDHESALATLALAEEREPDAELRTRIRDLRKKVDESVQRRADQPAVRAAELAHRDIARVIEIYLKGDVQRPPAREAIRLIDAWLAEHGPIAQRTEHIGSLRTELVGWRAQFAPRAALGEPDNGADILFAAELRLRYERRRYVAALAILDDWLARNQTVSPDGTAVRERAASIRVEGPRWVADRRATIERMLARGEREWAVTELTALVEGGLVPAEWLGDATERLRELRS